MVVAVRTTSCSKVRLQRQLQSIVEWQKHRSFSYIYEREQVLGHGTPNSPLCEGKGVKRSDKPILPLFNWGPQEPQADSSLLTHGRSNITVPRENSTAATRVDDLPGSYPSGSKQEIAVVSNPANIQKRKTLSSSFPNFQASAE